MATLSPLNVVRVKTRPSCQPPSFLSTPPQPPMPANIRQFGTEISGNSRTSNGNRKDLTEAERSAILQLAQLVPRDANWRVRSTALKAPLAVPSSAGSSTKPSNLCLVVGALTN